MMKMILETDRLPNIVQDFLRHADALRKLVEKATWEIVEDIRTMIYDRESKQFSNFHRVCKLMGSQFSGGLVVKRSTRKLVTMHACRMFETMRPASSCSDTPASPAGIVPPIPSNWQSSVKWEAGNQSLWLSLSTS